MSITANAEISEITIDYDIYGSSVDISIQNQSHTDLLTIQINDLTANIHDHVAIGLLHKLAEYYKFDLIDLENVK